MSLGLQVLVDDTLFLLDTKDLLLSFDPKLWILYLREHHIWTVLSETYSVYNWTFLLRNVFWQHTIFSVSV